LKSRQLWRSGCQLYFKIIYTAPRVWMTFVSFAILHLRQIASENDDVYIYPEILFSSSQVRSSGLCVVACLFLEFAFFLSFPGFLVAAVAPKTPCYVNMLVRLPDFLPLVLCPNNYCCVRSPVSFFTRTIVCCCSFPCAWRLFQGLHFSFSSKVLRRILVLDDEFFGFVPNFSMFPFSD